ncbi:MAG: sugar phosphate isomerase/epimerase family protein [Candidatus Avoscillospira sp.]
MEPVLGVNIPGGTNLAALEGALARIAADGWQAAELNLSSCPLIIGGRLQKPVADYMKAVMDKFPLHYTAHVGYGLDLRSADPIHRQVMEASLEACAALGIDRLNFHYEEHSKDYRQERQFLDWMREACDLGQDLGVRVNIENIEVEDVRYALDAVKALDHPNCGMTLDLGHLWLSANYFGYDYLPAVAACAPYVRHLHVNDNDGVFEPMRLTNQQLYNTLDKGYRFAFSRGDIHIPPLWGTAPLREAFSLLKQARYDGIWLCEYYSHLFHPLNDSIRRQVLDAIQTA